MEIVNKIDPNEWTGEGKCQGCWSILKITQSDLKARIVYDLHGTELPRFFKSYKHEVICPVCQYILVLDDRQVPLLIRHNLEVKADQELKEQEDKHYNSLSWFGKLWHKLTK